MQMSGFGAASVALGVALALTSVASAATVEGTVFEDVDGDGVLSQGDVALPGVAVGFETSILVKTDAAGRYGFTLPSAGIVWVRTPDGFIPTPVWRQLAAGVDATADLPLRREAITGDASFVHASDTHIGNGVSFSDLHRAFTLVNDIVPRPHFLVITGDLTQGNADSEFDELGQLLEDVELPFVPVIGNHDRYDGGTTYRSRLGPPQYCFDSGGMRFIVFDFANIGDVAGNVAFVQRCLEDGAGRPVAAFVHAPLVDGVNAALADAGVQYLFTGHWHSNRIIDHGALEEVNTQTFAFGGIDATPAGYRIARWSDGALVYTHHAVVEEEVLAIVYPAGDACVPPGPLDVIVAAESGAPLADEVRVSLDSGAAQPTAPRAGWSRVARVEVQAGQHQVVAALGSRTVSRAFCVAPRAASPALDDWPQHQGSPLHEGYRERAIDPPLVHLWARNVGGALRGGSVAVAGGRAFVPVIDLGSGAAGGVVALDAASGAPLWDVRLGSVHGTPAVFGELVIVATIDGVVVALDAADGHEVWRADLAAGNDSVVGWLYAPPTLADGNVYIGTQRRFVALDGATGRELWAQDPAPGGFWLGSFSAAGVGGGVVIAAFSRGAEGIVAWDADDGHELWRVPRPLSTAINASVVIQDDVAYIANAETSLFALDLLSPTGPLWSEWQRKLVGDANEWSYGVVGTPALARGRLVVPTMLGTVVAADAASGAEAWRYEGKAANLRMIHYLGSGHATFAASPVVTGAVAWVGGADGTLAGLDLETGRAMWSTNLGVPILSSLAAAGDVLLVGTFDGTVHALVRDVGQTCPTAPGCEVDDGGGCALGGGRSQALGWALLLVVVGYRLRRRRR